MVNILTAQEKKDILINLIGSCIFGDSACATFKRYGFEKNGWTYLRKPNRYNHITDTKKDALNKLWDVIREKEDLDDEDMVDYSNVIDIYNALNQIVMAADQAIDWCQADDTLLSSDCTEVKCHTVTGEKCLIDYIFDALKKRIKDSDYFSCSVKNSEINELNKVYKHNKLCFYQHRIELFRILLCHEMHRLRELGLPRDLLYLLLELPEQHLHMLYALYGYNLCTLTGESKRDCLFRQLFDIQALKRIITNADVIPDNILPVHNFVTYFQSYLTQLEACKGIQDELMDNHLNAHYEDTDDKEEMVSSTDMSDENEEELELIEKLMQKEWTDAKHPHSVHYDIAHIGNGFHVLRKYTADAIRVYEFHCRPQGYIDIIDIHVDGHIESYSRYDVETDAYCSRLTLKPHGKNSAGIALDWVPVDMADELEKRRSNLINKRFRPIEDEIKIIKTRKNTRLVIPVECLSDTGSVEGIQVFIRDFAPENFFQEIDVYDEVIVLDLGFTLSFHWPARGIDMYWNEFVIK